MDNVIRISDLLPEYYGRRHYKSFEKATDDEVREFMLILLEMLGAGFSEEESMVIAFERLGFICSHNPEYRTRMERYSTCDCCGCIVIHHG